MIINWESFINYLSAESIKNGQTITEAMLRYWFMEGIKFSVRNLAIEESYFGSKIKTGSSTPQLHKPKKNVPHADLYFEENGKSYVVEFKYGIGSNHTEMLGEVFNDLNRLSVINNDEKYFIYVFNKSMHDYCTGRFGDCFNVNYATSVHVVNPYINSHFATWKNTKNFPDAFIAKAFHSFNGLNDFSSFNYKIERIICKKIPYADLYIIVYKVS